MEMIENRMVVYPEQDSDMTEEVGDKLDGPGYCEMGTGLFVPEEDAFLYALERIRGATEEEKQEFVEWFYSGNWVHEDDNAKNI